MDYNIYEILLVFFSYAFIGWLWECFFVSTKSGTLVNRGFFHGPLLPIYGFGALLILATTRNIHSNLYLVFIVGMVNATALEYFTGAALERIFKVRYWDYSHFKYNLNGYINLNYSIGWGLVSVLLVDYAHPKVNNFIISLNANVVETVSIGLLLIFLLDVIKSIKDAFKFKKLLEAMSDNDQRFAEFVTEINGLIQTVNKTSETLKEKSDLLNKKASESILEHEKKLGLKNGGKKPLISQNLENINTLRKQTIEEYKIILDQIFQETQMWKQKFTNDIERQILSKTSNKLIEVKTDLKELEEEFTKVRGKSLKEAKSIIKRNPGITSNKLKVALERIKSNKL